MRTIQVLGKAYADAGSVTMVCNVTGLGEVFNGVVPTVNTAPPDQNVDMEVLFSFDVADTLVNTIIASDITCTGGTAYVATIAANQLNPADFTQFITLYRDAGDLKQDVRLDGVLLDNIEPADGWHYEIPDGSTLSIDWKIRKLRYGGVPGNPLCGAIQLIPGIEYEITNPGNTDWTALGAADNNIGTIFTATGPAVGTTGKAKPTSLP